MKYDAILKIVNELAEKQWTPVVKRKGEVRKLRKGDGTRINPVISSDKELSLASARDIKYHNLDGVQLRTVTICCARTRLRAN